MPRALPWFIVLAGGALAAYIDLHTGDDPQLTALALLFAGGALGVFTRGAWRWAILVGLFVPAAEIFGVLTVGAPSHTMSNVATSVIALPFPLAGAVLGALSVRALHEDGYTLRP